MRITSIISTILTVSVGISCTGNRLEEKGFSVRQETEKANDNGINGTAKDSLTLQTRPGSVLLTGNPQFRLTTIYKVNYREKDGAHFIGSNSF